MFEGFVSLTVQRDGRSTENPEHTICLYLHLTYAHSLDYLMVVMH